MDTINWRLLLNLFHPRKPIAFDELDKYFVERPGSPLPDLVLRVRGQEEPAKILVTGQIGSGKSSELRALMRQLADEFFIVWFDGESSLDLLNSGPITMRPCRKSCSKIPSPGEREGGCGPWTNSSRTASSSAMATTISGGTSTRTSCPC
jgi:hypothetical protein